MAIHSSRHSMVGIIHHKEGGSRRSHRRGIVVVLLHGFCHLLNRSCHVASYHGMCVQDGTQMFRVGTKYGRRLNGDFQESTSHLGPCIWTSPLCYGRAKVGYKALRISNRSAKILRCLHHPVRQIRCDFSR